ncbi:MAG: DUF2436 domain-containing protein [Muribaculaceae bacterium]|nr:DUF2436 domain-containing protein [Muribaculaceae bacterium]
MKKLLFVLLTAALALPMMAQTKADEAAAMANYRRAAVPSFTLQRQHVQVVANRDEVPAGYASVTLAADDVWGDGSGYQMLLDADATAFGTIIPETGGLTTSGDADAATYAEFEYKIPENADGSLTTQNMVCDDAVTILIPAGVYDWCITNPTPGDRVWIASSNGTCPGRYDDFEFADGATYIFYVSFGGYNDQVELEIVDPTAPVAVEGLNVTVDGTNANVAWTNDHDPAFNLRYRVYDPDMAQDLFWDFDSDESLEGWMTYDADGDGYPWRLDAQGIDGSYCLVSDSYYSGALSPDNWVFSPEVKLGGTLKFWTANYSGYYIDKIAVYAIEGDIDFDNFDPEAFVLIEDNIEPGQAFEEYTFEIPAELRGNGHFAFRHYDCYDQFRIFVDDVTYTVPGNEPGEWTVVEGIEGNEYLLEGLEAETTYEVQVQAIGANETTGNWTEVVLFTTGEAGQVTPPEPEDPHMTGKWLVLINQDGDEVWYAMNDDPEGENNWFLMLTLHHYPWNENVPFYFMVDGVQMGAETDMYLPQMGDEAQTVLNPVFEGENMFYVPSTYTYTWGLQLQDGQYYLLVAQGPQTAVNEINGGKTVSSVRYFNVAGQEMQEANGMTIVVTTYTDGTTSAAKVIK